VPEGSADPGTHPAIYPGDLTELAFVESYLNGALRKPQVVSDSVLRTLVVAGTGDRLMLTGLLAEQVAEACRRLVAVWDALADRRYPIARTLLAPLPGLAAWERFIQQAATFAPEQVLRELSLGEDALPSAELLRGQPDLDALSPLVAASETGSAMILIRGASGTVAGAWVAGVDAAGTPVAASLEGDEREAATLADMTADLVSVARGFLGDYLFSRSTAGRRA
jgi:hypothetical protein